jgi:transcriptional regulator with XRE-family HTH domain
MLTPEQSRAARGWLDWSQDDLAQQANVSPSTVRDFEKGRRTPIANNLDAIVRAFEGEGLTFENAEDGKPLGIKAANLLSVGI